MVPLVVLLLFASALGQGSNCHCQADEVLVVGADCLCRCMRQRHDLSCESTKCPPGLENCAASCCFMDIQCNENGVCRAGDGLDFVTAAKIAVLFALVVTCLAVLVALFRAFLLPRWCSGRLRRADADSRSLNSVQRFVLERLSTRPPPYEHQPEKPPTYEECIAGGDEVVADCGEAAPPSYGVAVIDLPPAPPPYQAHSSLPSTADCVMPPTIGFRAPPNTTEIVRQPASDVRLPSSAGAEGSGVPLSLDVQALAALSLMNEMTRVEVVKSVQDSAQEGLDNRGFEADESSKTTTSQSPS